MFIVNCSIRCLLGIINITFKRCNNLLNKSQNYDIGPILSQFLLLINIGVLSLFLNNIIDVSTSIKSKKTVYFYVNFY